MEGAVGGMVVGRLWLSRVTLDGGAGAMGSHSVPRVRV